MPVRIGVVVFPVGDIGGGVHERMGRVRGPSLRSVHRGGVPRLYVLGDVVTWQHDLPRNDTGYGHGPDEVGKVHAPAELLSGYYHAVHRLTLEYVAGVTADELHGVEHTVVPDRVEAATYMCATGVAGGQVMLHNARAEYADEAHEIATYMVIDSLATTVGDKETAKLARTIMREEERMQTFLAGLLPELTAGVAHDEIPISELPDTPPKTAAKA